MREGASGTEPEKRSEKAGRQDREPYTEFAAIYDAVMRDVAYDMWADYVEEICSRHRLRPATILDVACGTGGSSIPFARRGYRVAGVDNSRAMLDVARAKAVSHGLDIEFALQDMRDLHPEALTTGPEFDLVICLYDSINYLTRPHELADALRGFLRAVRPGGLFIFDVNSATRLIQMTETSIFMEGPGWAFIEQNDYDPATRIWEIRVTGFVRTRGNLYRRFREVHRERAYTEREIRDLLAGAGFETLAAYNAFGLEPAGRETARIYFVARRPAVER
ncbi:MAG: class I SAM-dependent methyltransferase [Bacillota bacterium]|nr:MAG: class I SAM-dependent methyltransferase [Bacillota bacterium]